MADGGQPGLLVSSAPETGWGRMPNISPGKRPAWARRIVEARSGAGLNQRDAAERLGMSQSGYGQYETGKTEPDAATYRTLGRIFGVRAAWLAFGEEDQRDAAAIGFVEANKRDLNLSLAVLLTAEMLDKEGIGSDLAFLVELARKFAGQAKRATNQAEANELIRAAVERERLELREGLEALKKRSV
jgi:transcriptional regulator with XRE-family HTH domain